ncbi:hypothetical protein AB205_0217140 [Aquarana catesbeiana]|uniref:Uncharacterized protein n=1 Tax=Aquarana catesbeiana TaxID=8400 RepID=A0A2G9RQ78_AQUCT|nr:hypothetical protein AB205_0217140 [Aquarana catesbeiana]
MYICVTDDYRGNNCDYWGFMGWNTGGDWGYKPQSALDKKDKNGKSLLNRMTLLKTGTCSNSGRTGHNMKFTLTIENPSPTDAGTYVLGTWLVGSTGGMTGKFQLKDMYNSSDWQPPQPIAGTYVLGTWLVGSTGGMTGKFQLKDMYNSSDWQPPQPIANPLRPHIQKLGDMVAIADPTFDTMAAETGFSDVKLWMRYSAEKHNKTNCYGPFQRPPRVTVGTYSVVAPAPQPPPKAQFFYHCSTMACCFFFLDLGLNLEAV